MNEKSHVPSEDVVRFDRLVDGELSGEEYSRLLASLDDQPGGWRRCALAFLEAQALGQDLSAARYEMGLPTATQAAEPFWKSPAPRSLWLAVAATFLVALGLGFALRDVSIRTSSLAVSQPEKRPAERSGAENEIATDHNSRRAPLGNLSLVVNPGEDSRGEQIDLPVFDSSDSDAWRSMDSSGLPPDVRRVLERMGHRVEQQRELMPFELRDGRQVVVPVEQYRIVPASRPSY